MKRPNRYNSYAVAIAHLRTYTPACIKTLICIQTLIMQYTIISTNLSSTNNDPTSILTTIRHLSSSLVRARVHARVRPPIHSPYLRWSHSVDLSAPLPPCASAARKEEGDVETCAFICAHVPF